MSGKKKAKPPKTQVTVPRGSESEQPAYKVEGKNVLKVANWILKGVSKVHHGCPELWMKNFPITLGSPLDCLLDLPQYVDDPGDRRFGTFDPELRRVIWDRDAFCKAFVNKGPALGPEGQIRPQPDSLEVATDNKKPHWAEWVVGYEYFFRATWVVDSGPRGTQGTYTLDIKPSRDGSLSFSHLKFQPPRGSGSDVEPRASGSGDANGDANGASGSEPRGSGSALQQELGLSGKLLGTFPGQRQRGIAAAQAERWSEGRLARKAMAAKVRFWSEIPHLPPPTGLGQRRPPNPGF